MYITYLIKKINFPFSFLIDYIIDTILLYQGKQLRREDNNVRYILTKFQFKLEETETIIFVPNCEKDSGFSNLEGR